MDARVQYNTRGVCHSLEPRSLGCADKELGAVRVLATVGHGKDTRSSVSQTKVLVRKLVAVDGLATCVVDRQNMKCDE